MATGVIEIKLGTAMNLPNRLMNDLLEKTAKQCNIARNKMARQWQRWREDNPDWKPAQRRTRDGSPKVALKSGKPIMETDAMPQDLDNELYHIGRAIAPSVGSKIISHCRAEVVELLQSRMPYNHKGSKFKWAAILNSEINLPSFRNETVPIPNQDVILCYDGDLSKEKIGVGLKEQILNYGKSSVVIRFPLLSKQSGFDNTHIVCRLEARQLSASRRNILRKIATRDLKMSDSRIVYKRGSWFFQLTYKIEPKNWNLDKEKVAVLTALPPSAKRPFELRLPDGRRWYLGEGDTLENEYTRLVIRRKTIRRRYQDGNGAGHGKEGFFSTLRPLSRKVMDMQDRFTKSLIADVIRSLVKNNCGKLVYREPSLPLRERLWLNRRGLPFNWTKFIGSLKYKTENNTIDFEPERINAAEHNEQYIDYWKKPFKSRMEQIEIVGVEGLAYEPGKGKPGHQHAPLATGQVVSKE